MRSKLEFIEDILGALQVNRLQSDALDSLAASRLGLNRTDLYCLRAIEIAGGLTAGQIATAACLTTGAVTGVIDRLERAGYARRIADPHDRRRVRVEVTPAFQQRAAEIWLPVHAEWMEMISATFSVSELASVANFLARTTELGARHAEQLAEP